MALTNGADIKPCKLIQQSVADLFGSLQLESNKPITGIYNALTSPINKIGMQMTPIVSNGDTKVDGTTSRIVQIKGILPTCTDACEAPATECNVATGTENERFFKNFIVEDSCSVGLTLTDSEFYEFCDNRNSYITEQVANKLYSLERSVESKLAVKLNGLMGTYSNGVSSSANPIYLPFINADKTPNIGVFTSIMQSYLKKGYTNAPIYVSSSLQILNLMNPYLATTDKGINMSGLDLSRHYFSNLLDTYLTPAEEAVLTWIPGTFQLVEYQEYLFKRKSVPQTLVINGVTVNTASEEIVPFRFNGRDYTLYYKYDCGVHTWRWNYYFDVLPLPTEAVCDNKYPALKFLNKCLDTINCGDINCVDL